MNVGPAMIVKNESAMPVFCDFDWAGQAFTPGGNSPGVIGIQVRLVRIVGGREVQVNKQTFGVSRSNQGSTAGTKSDGGQSLFLDFDTGWAGGNRTYRLQVRVIKTGAAGSAYWVKGRCSVEMVCWKR